MLLKIKKTAETEIEVDINTPAYFTDGYYCKTLYKICESGKIVGITIFSDGHFNILEYSSNIINFDKLQPSTEAEFEQAKGKLIKYIETI